MTSSENCEFAFNARQYFDFTESNDDENLDAYFEHNREYKYQNSNGNFTNAETTPKPFIQNDESFSTEEVTDLGYFLRSKAKLRKSCSMNDLCSQPKTSKTTNLSAKLSNLKMTDSSSVTSLNSMARKHKTLSKENLERLAQPKNVSKQKEFVSLAEAVTRFQNGTPLRFHSQPSIKLPLLQLASTKAETPKLQTKNRTRPVYAISREEQEKIELETAKMFKIRANPVNKKALQAPMKPEISRKAPTIPEPFMLTECKKKEIEAIEKYVFHAKPAPKTTKESFTIKVERVVTIPQTPNFVRKQQHEEPKKPLSAKVMSSPKVLKPRRTQLVPFSFEKRDELILKKKEDLVRKTLEEEKKAREFHARPMPKKNIRSRANSFSSETSNSKSKHENSQQDEELHAFKAKPATILYKKPFIPKKEHHYVEIEEFNFSVERRLEERKEFDRQLKEAEEQQRLLKEEREQEELRKLEEERAILRKMTDFNAQPIRKYREVKIEPSHKVTEPKSPKFQTAERIRNKENILFN